MKPLSIVGIILIICGVLVLASEGITYTKSEKIIDIGPIEATAKHGAAQPLSPESAQRTLENSHADGVTARRGLSAAQRRRGVVEPRSRH